MEKTPHPLDISRVSEAIRTTPEYREARNDEHPTPLVIQLASRALTEAATNQESGYRNKDGDVFNVISHMESFAEGQFALDEEKAGLTQLSGMERREAKLAVVGFNHAIKELISNNPKLQFTEVVDFVSTMYRRTHVEEMMSLPKEQQAAQFHNFSEAVKASVHGMRNEVGYEQIIGELQRQDVDVDYTSDVATEDDLRGADMFITLDGIRFPVDIKASYESAQRENARGRHSVVWSHLEYEDFGNQFRLPVEIIQARAAYVLRDIQSARRSSLAA